MAVTPDIVSVHAQKVKSFHDSDAAGYEERRYRCDTCEGLAYVTRREILLGQLIPHSGRILDIGCGPGILTSDLIRRDLEVYSADLSMEMIRHARQRVLSAPGRGTACFVVSDVSGICFAPSSMDAVLCVGVVCYVRDYLPLLAEIFRVLKPGGRAVIQIDNIRWPLVHRALTPFYRFLKRKLTSKSYEGLSFVFNYFSRKVFLRDLATAGFAVTRLAPYDFRLPFVDVVLPKIAVKLASLMYRGRSSPFMSRLAHGLLVECRKSDAPGGFESGEGR